MRHLLLLLTLLVAACDVPAATARRPPIDMSLPPEPGEVVAEGGPVEVHQQALTTDSYLRPIYAVNFTKPWDGAIQHGVTDPPMSSWTCGQVDMYATYEPAPGQNPNDPALVISDQRSYATAVTVTASSDCVTNGVRMIERCEYKFAPMAVDHTRPVRVWMIPMTPTGGFPAWNEPPKTYTLPSAGSFTGPYEVPGFFQGKNYWAHWICGNQSGDSCFGVKTLVQRECTFNGQACVAPCNNVTTTW